LEKRHDKIQWDKIKPPAASVIKPYKSIEKPSPERCSQLANKLAVLKLNGGLGTTMGCVGPKSVIEVTDGQTFLDISVKQIQYLNSANKASVPLVLMNSFNTHKDTLNVLKKYKYGSVVIHTFNQSRYPRVWKESLIPVPTSPDSAKQEWYPPGHGDVYESLYNSGLLEQLIEEGKEYLFLSNVDNLGATVDFNILSHMEATGAEFLMEVTDKTRSDVKGGTLIEYNDKLMLLEIAQVPANNVEEFKSIKKFKIFNTNNLWINLKAVKRIIESKGLKDMPVIENNKSFAGKPVIQLERAAGAAIQFFKGGVGVNVPRTRFLPVKSTSDLLVVQSNLFQLKSGKLVNNPARPFPGPPFVKLGAEFKKVSEYNRRIKGRHPNLLELDQLTIAGDVCIGSDVTLKVCP